MRFFDFEFEFTCARFMVDDVHCSACPHTDMRKLLNISNEYGKEFNIKFNAMKYKWLAVVPRKRCWLSSQLDFCQFQVVATMLEYRRLYILVIIINSELSDKDDILRGRCTFIGQVNNVLCYFTRLAADVKYQLFRSYCSSIFGCELLHLNNINISTFCTAWRTGLRRIWNWPNTTHSDLLHLLC